LIVNAAGLHGYGKLGSWTDRDHSSNILIDPIDYRFMRTSSDKPNVLVTVNDILAVAKSDNRYTFIDYIPILIYQ